MPEIDLIPSQYREELRVRRALIRIGLTFAVALLALAGGRVGLAVGIRNSEHQIDVLERDRVATEQRRSELSELSSGRTALQQQLAILSGLRGGVAARDMFVSVDRALDEEIWFKHWSFGRAGELVERPATPEHRGYFILVPEADGEPERAWRVQTHMEIEAQASNHTSLAAFVRRLLEQPEIAEVRVLRSYAAGAGSVVNFELAVVVRTGRAG
jgi:Tfp pilus assembly protein PilN